MKLTSKFLLISFLCIGLMILLSQNWLPGILFNRLSVEFTGKHKQCPAMYLKSKNKIIQNKGKESRSAPFWSNRKIKENHLFITNTGNPGRLGNKLFEFATVFGVSKLNNRTPMLEQQVYRTWENINKYFDARIGMANFTAASNFTIFREKECHIIINETKKLPKINVTLGSFLITRRYFEDAEEELRRELMFKDSVIGAARKYLTDQSIPHLSEGATFARVVIHVRRGDLLKEHSEVPGFMDITSEYFSDSMAYFRQCYDRVQFVVLSQDMEWCKKNIVGPDVIYSEGHSPGEDLAISSLSDHAITTRGTYSMWAAWFANGKTIRPLKSAKPNSAASEKFELEQESFPSGVVVI